MRRGITDAIMFLESRGEALPERGLKVVGKISYRTHTAAAAAAAAEESAITSNDKMEGDVLQEQNDPTETVYHNLSTSYITETLNKSPLAQLHKNRKEVDVIYCAHNPEAQGMELLAQDASLEDVRGFVRERLTEAFVALERQVGEEVIGSYGVCSNGLSLPSSHPMHLSWEDVLHASADAAKEVHGPIGSAASAGSSNSNMSTLQMPINLLETHGLKVANRVKQYIASPDAISVEGIPRSIQIHSTRPLTCYPDRGTGTGHPFKLVDYMIPTAEDGSGKGWSHMIKSAPAFYTTLLNETMAHFDATHILEIKDIEKRELTVEERETLDGCKLLQSMIHDLDANLSTGRLRSFAAYEEDLYTKVVPLIHDTFEELDSDSVDLLQRFFLAHGTAVRHTIAKTTRTLLKEGGDGVDKYDIPDEETIQDFALRFLLEQQCVGDYAKGPLIDRVIVGCPRAEHVIEAVQAADKVEA